jgi:dual specificity MAP kinase phosphatase
VNPETAKSSPDISQINDYLYLSAWPEGEHADEIRELGVRLILSMHWGRPSRTLREPPLRLLWLPTMDSPLTPMPVASLQRGVEAALPVIRDGGGVLTHCRYGIHRSAAMACCVLIGMGFTSEQAMQLVKEKRPIADPYIWYIRRRIEKFERHWKRVHS